MNRQLYRTALLIGVMKVLLSGTAGGLAYAGNIDPNHNGSKYAYGENIGWINLSPSQGPGVTVTDTAVTGQAWGENIGWITFDPTYGGVSNDGAGKLSGYAWGENVGWINFAPTGGGVRIDPATGVFSGYAWGENIGWINFASTGAAVTTAWREKADLAVSSIALSPSPAAVGQRVTVTATITNEGGTTAGNFEVDMYKNLSTKPAVGQAGDLTCPISGLAAGASTHCSGQVSYDTVMTANVWAQADTLNTVTEVTKTNNTSHTGLAVKLPDVRITALTVPSSAVTVGQPVSVSAVVKNVSVVDIIGAFKVDLYKDLAGAPGLNQVGDVNCTVDGLASQATATCDGTVTYASAGTYSAWAQADTTNAVNESNETNNVAGPASVSVVDPYTLTLNTTGNGSGTVSGNGTYNAGDTAIISETPGVDSVFNGWSGPNAAECSNGSVLMNADKSCTATFSLANPPDLVVSSITATPSPAAVGQTVTITATITNQGSSTDGTFVVEFYKNLSSAPSIGQPGDASCTVNGLAAGASIICSGEVSYDATGNDIVWALADATGVVTEANERNNTNHTGVAVRLPDLRVISLSVTPTTVAVGSDLIITATVEDVSAVDVINTFDVDLYKDSATAPTVGQGGAYTCTVDGLAARATSICSTTVTYGSAGTYNVWSQADTQNTVNETYETNNLKGPTTLTVK